jgi:hypothetical protein
MEAKLFGAVAICVLVSASARAEYWPTLDRYVGTCDLIVLCKTEFVDGKPIFKIEEEWKGKFSATDFNEFLEARIPKSGYLPAGLSLHSGRKPHEGQQVVFFFTHRKERKYDGSSTSFDMRDGKLIYGESGNPGVPKEYTLAEFKKAILAIVKSQQSGNPTAQP